MLSSPVTVKIFDKEYQSVGFTQKVQTEFEKYMQYQDRSLIKSQAEVLESDYLDLLHKHLWNCKNGKLSFGSKFFWDFIDNDDNLAKLYAWTIQAAENGIGEDVVKKWLTECHDEAVAFFKLLWDSKKN